MTYLVRELEKNVQVQLQKRDRFGRRILQSGTKRGTAWSKDFPRSVQKCECSPSKSVRSNEPPIACRKQEEGSLFAASKTSCGCENIVSQPVQIGRASCRE